MPPGLPSCPALLQALALVASPKLGLRHRIPSKTRVVRVKAHEVPRASGFTIHLMLGKTLEKECMGGYGMLCVMCVLDEFELKEATNLVGLPKCVKQVLENSRM